MLSHDRLASKLSLQNLAAGRILHSISETFTPFSSAIGFHEFYLAFCRVLMRSIAVSLLNSGKSPALLLVSFRSFQSSFFLIFRCFDFLGSILEFAIHFFFARFLESLTYKNLRGR